MTRSTLSILCIATLAAAQFACSPVTYGASASVEIETDWSEEMTFDIFTDMETPKRGLKAKGGNLPSSFGSQIKTLDPEAAFTVELWDGEKLLKTVESTEGDIWNVELEENEPGQVASVSVAPLYKNCGWNDLCARDLQLVVTGTSSADLFASFSVGMMSEDVGHQGLDKAIAELEVVEID